MSNGRFVLLKRGAFWRPDGAGYTNNLLQAGVYDQKEAEQHDAWAREFPQDATTSRPLDEAVGEYVRNGLTREVLAAVLARLGMRLAP